MSRCYPFPPPGYEKKARIEDLDLLKKEEHRKKREKEKSDHKEKRKRRKRDKSKKEKDRDKYEAINLNQGNFISAYKKCGGLSANLTGSEFNKSSHLPGKTTEFQILSELERRIQDDDGELGNLLGEKFSIYDGMGRMVAKVTAEFNKRKANNENEGRVESRDDRKKHDDPMFSKSATQMEKMSHRKIEENWRTGKWNNEEIKEKQEKDGNHEGKRNGDRKKKEKLEQRIRNLEESNGSSKNDVRVDIETHETLNVNDENRRTLKPSESSVPSAANLQVKTNDPSEEHEINGNIETTVLSSKLYSKPPHPDCKYLSQVYLVPKMEEWSDFCDQEWLFSRNSSKLKKVKVKVQVQGMEMEMTTPEPSVWDEALQIESIGIYALPYVIPY